MRSLIIKTALCLVFFSSSTVSAEESKAPEPIDAGAADLPPSIDAVPADLQPDALKVEPLIPTAPPATAPEPPVDPKQFKELENQVVVLTRKNDLLKEDLDALKKQMALLEGRVNVLVEDGRYKFATAGLGPSFSTGNGSGTAFKLEGSIGGFTGFYYIDRGGGIAWNMVIYVKKRVRISPLGFGLMVYQDSGNAFTSRWLKRSVDMVLPIGVDVRVWKGVTVGAQISWFIPNPVDVAIAAENAGKTTANNANPILGMSSLTDASNNVLKNSAEVVSQAFGDAFESPRIEFTVKWSFE
jgi:hypothetical protein